MVEEKASNSKVRIVTVREGQGGQRLDNFLAGFIGGSPRSLVYKIIRTGQVRVNGGRARPASRLEVGDQVRIPPVRQEPTPVKRAPREAVAAVSAAIVAQDDDLIVLDKPAGIAVHAGSGVHWGLIDAVRALPGFSEAELVHRLDRETSGLLLLARHKGAMRALQAQFREGFADKRYLCLMDGRMNDSRTLVDQPLRKTQRGGQRFVEAGLGGKPAQTEFFELEPLRQASYVEARLYTGRTHQIRAHAAWLGCPLAGDPLYSEQARLAYWKNLGLERLFLHAHQLAFEDPQGRTRNFSCPLPPALRHVLDGLQGKPGR